jgi:2-polyprenyl-3-methyl-5-hydroxy-6-metoxy-1,4-benzoquinol methylase
MDIKRELPDEYRENCPELKKIVDLIAGQNPLQKKRINAFLENQTAEYWIFAEGLSKLLNRSFLVDSDFRVEAARSYNKMCMDFLKEQIKFRKTGIYSVTDAAVANQKVYSDINVMRYYMIGLLLSYMFWPNHYQLFRFFENHLPKNQISNCLEVGVGHGLFTSTMLKKYKNLDSTLVDISETSISTAKEILQAFQINLEELTFILGDFLSAPLGNQLFDYIIMGEVLEHVNDAPLFMERTKELLSQNGTVYLSTCANSPALDHVYHFHSVEEIQDLLRSAGFKICSELALPAEDIPRDQWAEELITINYCALLEHE